MRTGWQTIDGKKYNFGSDGALRQQLERKKQKEICHGRDAMVNQYGDWINIVIQGRRFVKNFSKKSSFSKKFF